MACARRCYKKNNRKSSTKLDMLITVFTPTYNRAKLLPRLHKSLQEQTNKDIEWVIVDDGSTDNTKEIIENVIIQQENDFPIRYFYKENGGKHTAINQGVKEAKGELFFIADSDDLLPNNSIEIVVNEFVKIKDKKEIGAIVGFDNFINKSNSITEIPFKTEECTFTEFANKWRINQDMKEVFRTSVLKEIPFPEIENERFCPEDLEWLLISHKYLFHYFDKFIYTAEYQENGLSANITKIRMNSPILTTWTYAEYNEFNTSIYKKIRNAINYWRFYFCIEDKSKIRKRINPFWIGLSPIGWLFHIKDRIRIKKK